MPRRALLSQLNLTEQVQQRIGIGLSRVRFERREVIEVEYLVTISFDLNQDEVPDPPSQPGKHVLRTVGLRNRFRRGQDGSDRLQGLGRTKSTSSCWRARMSFTSAVRASPRRPSLTMARNRASAGEISRFRMSAASTCVRAGVVKRRA